MENAIQRMRRGYGAAAERQRELERAEGPRPERAVAEALAAVAALAEMGRWPAPRDPVSERSVEEVRRRWARIERRAKEPARGDHLLEDAIEALARALDATGASWMIIGGIAVIARGVRRFTADVDAAVRGDAVSIPRLLKALQKERIAARIPDAAALARANLVLLARHEPTGVDLDVSLAWSDFEHEALAARAETSFGRSRRDVLVGRVEQRQT